MHSLLPTFAFGESFPEDLIGLPESEAARSVVSGNVIFTISAFRSCQERET